MSRSSDAPLCSDALSGAAIANAKSMFQSVLTFAAALVAPQNRKATIVLCYAVLFSTFCAATNAGKPPNDAAKART
ncbi:MAG: hypothetical protein IIY07_01895, partial [Thermoguttaceae bacterium]|nr:hypothetical protein [Thermoguttaceae bacterium]